jgi:hypothetical protein
MCSDEAPGTLDRGTLDWVPTKHPAPWTGDRHPGVLARLTRVLTPAKGRVWA